MLFLNISMLWLIIIPLVLFVFVKRTNFNLDKFFSTEMIDKISLSKEGVPASQRAFVFNLALVFLILALGRPVQEKAEIDTIQKLIPIVIVLDVSKSMLAEDIYPNRLLLAKKKTKQIIQLAKNSNIGIILFAKSAFILSPISEDISSLLYIIDRFDENIKFNNGSDVMSTLKGASDIFAGFKSKNIIILSDGGNANNYDEEINFVKENNITVYTIGMATKIGAPIPEQNGQYLVGSAGKIVNVGLNEAIGTLAIQSGGGYIGFSLDDSDIIAILKQINKQAKKQKFKSHKIKTYIEYFYYPLFTSLLLLFISFISISSLRELFFKTTTKNNQDHRSNKHHQNKQTNTILFILCLLSTNPFMQIKSNVLNFKHISDANNFYNSGNFNKSITSFKKISNSEQKHYNLANAYYKNKQYTDAIKNYKLVKSENKELKYKSLHNIGNAYFLLGKLKEAQKNYEDALQLKDDKQTKHNLEELKKLKKKQEQQKQKRQQQKQQNNQSKPKDEKKDKKDKDKEDKNDKKGDKEQKDKDKKGDKEQKNKDKKGDKNDKDKDSKKNNMEKTKKIAVNPNEISNKEENKWLKRVRDTKTPILMQKINKDTGNDNTQGQNPW